MSLKTKEIWFIVGSQFLYGPKVLETVAARGQEMAAGESRRSGDQDPLTGDTAS